MMRGMMRMPMMMVVVMVMEIERGLFSVNV